MAMWKSYYEIDHAIYDLLTSQYTKNPELCSVCYEDEFGLEFYWNRVLNYDSVEELGQLACFKCLFSLRAGVTLESSM